MTSLKNYLIIAASETDADMYYATRFLAPDPFIFMQIRGRKHLLMSDLEVDRARTQSSVHQVHSLSRLAKEFMARKKTRPGYLDLIEHFAKKNRVRRFTVPENFPLAMADRLRKRGLRLDPKPDPFFTERTLKTKFEVHAVASAIRRVEKAVGRAVATLRQSIIRKGKLYYHGELLTSESLRRQINLDLMADGLVGSHAIVSCGKHAVDPHDEGSGPLYANQSIIMDIFPRDTKTRYHADFTRTVVRGKASPRLKQMYAAVKHGQDIAFKMIRHGAEGSRIHKAIHQYFESLGFKTGVIKGRMQGFFHGTGHGLGLDIHEQPSISPRHDILKAGHVVTVEPGLYYEGLGGVRLEDVVLVTKTGCINLTQYPKFLEI